MLKKWIYYTSILFISAFISLGFNKKVTGENLDEYRDEVKMLHIYPSEKSTDYPTASLLLTGKSFTGFKEALAYRESRGQYKLVNSFGYMGKYQFGTSALRAIGISNTRAFLNSREMQEEAFKALLAKNKFLLRDEIERFEGEVIAGIEVTESGILAAAHLLGAGSVKKFFRNNGEVYIRDGYGTSLRSYLKDFAHFDTSSITADDNARVGK